MTKYLYTAAQCRNIDRIAMQNLGLSGLQLMQRAADAALDVLSQRWPDVRCIEIYCGPGNNGGDGCLLAEALHKLAYRVRVYAVLAPVSELAIAASARTEKCGLVIQGFSDAPVDVPGPDAELIVDAIFGHGLARPIEGGLAKLIDALNESGRPLFALDIPSGINSDTGRVMGVGIHAGVSCSFIAPKLGMHTGSGPDYCGTIFEKNLGVSTRVYAEVSPTCEVLSEQIVLQHLAAPDTSSHKGDFGHVAIVGGHFGMVGAVILSALAAARSGAGRVTVFSDKRHIHLIQQANPVLMSSALGNEIRIELPGSINAMALGPGLGRVDESIPVTSEGGAANWSLAVFKAALKAAGSRRIPLVVDADGLILLASGRRTGIAQSTLDDYVYPGGLVLTPHPKEAAILLGCSVQEVEADRPQACFQIARDYQSICVLKGHGSLVSDGQLRMSLCTLGNWGMATAGSGDVLTGIVGAFLAVGMPPYAAAQAAVWVHARAGDLAVIQHSRRSLLASDLIEFLGQVFLQLEAD